MDNHDLELEDALSLLYKGQLGIDHLRRLRIPELEKLYGKTCAEARPFDNHLFLLGYVCAKNNMPSYQKTKAENNLEALQ